MAAQRPKVSIGMPVHNGAKNLPQAIESLLAQDYTDFELIISDNASDDGSYGICEQYAAQDSRIRLYRNPHNLGASPNFNRLVDLARGEYFKWNGHDDWCAPEFLSECVAILEADPTAVAAYPQTAIMDKDGTLLEYFVEPTDASSPDPVKRYENLFANLILTNMVFGLVRTHALRKTQRLPRYRWGQRVMVLELALQGRIYLVPEPLFFRRIPRRTGPRTRKRSWLDISNRRIGPPSRLDLYYHYCASLLGADISAGSKTRLLMGTILARLLFPREARRLLRRRLARGFPEVVLPRQREER